METEISAPQRNIWLTEELNEGSNINTLFGTFVMPKILDIDILKKAINKIVETNDVMRMKIMLKDGVPMQRVQEYEPDDIKSYFFEERTKEVDELIDSIGYKYIDILKDKLYNFQIFQTKKETIVTVKLHHIIGDAWTMMQVVEQIKGNYNAIRAGQTIENKPSYLEFVKREGEYKKSNRYQRDEAFWKEYVKEIEPVKSNKEKTDKLGKRIEKEIPIDVFNKIQAYCEKNNISEYLFLLTAISVYYTKILNRQDIVIATPYLNRQKAAKELETLGMFISTLPIRVNIDKNQKFIDVCKQVNSVNIACFKHGKYPYEEIQRQYQIQKEDKSNLYEISFSYQINKLENDIDGEKGQTFWYYNGMQSTPLLISYVNHFGEHKLYYDYMIANMSDTDINDIHYIVLKIIEQVLETEDVYVKDITILSNENIEKLNQFNNVGIQGKLEKNIIQTFEDVVAKNPTKIALKCGEEALTYKEFNAKVNQLAVALKNNNATLQTPIAIMFDKSLEMLISMFAVMKIGAYYIPILPEEETERMKYILENSKAQLLLTHKNYENKIEDLKIKAIQVDKYLEEDVKVEEITYPDIKLDDLSYMIYTSGTTGLPKGVMMQHKNIVSLVNSVNADEELKVLENDVAISLLKYSFDASAIDIYTMLLNGGTLALVPKEIELQAEKVLEIIDKEKVTRSFTVSKWIEQINDIDADKNMNLEHLRILCSGGDTFKPNKFEKILKKYKNLGIYNLYGPTEATMFVTKKKVEKANLESNYITIGKPIPNSRIAIINDRGDFLPINCQGEILIYEEEDTAQNIAKGYWGLEEKTKEKFIQFYNPVTKRICTGYKTGDIAKINNELEIEFCGRRDDFVKVNGAYLVSLNEVEFKIQKILGANIEICAVAVPFRGTKTIILFVAPKLKNRKVKVENIKYLIKDNITFYMNPKKVILVDSIPLTKNGKVDRKQMEKMAIEEINKVKSEIVLPRDEDEQYIYDKVKELVNTEFSIYDDFEDELGIDSLDMTILHSQLAKKDLQIQDLYNYSNVASLALLLKNIQNEEKIKEEDKVLVLNNAKKIKMKNVLITGTTGFLGAHILKELVIQYPDIEKIYCIVRSKYDATSEERFERNINYYFEKEIGDKINQKVIILDGELTKSKLDLEDEQYEEINDEVDTIINSAAVVKHIGKYETFYRENVESVKNLLELAKKNNKNFIYISTLSLAGDSFDTAKIWDENSLVIGQNLGKNPYLISKMEAEKLILKTIETENLNAKIFRVGNVTPRMEDGKFQKNKSQNAFMLSMNTLIGLHLKCEAMNYKKLSFAPVDETSQAIVKLIEADLKNNIFHMESDKMTDLYEVVKQIEENGIEMKEVEVDIFKDQVDKKNTVGANYIRQYFKERSPNIIEKNITINALANNNFKWKNNDKRYIQYIIDTAKEIGWRENN